MSVSEQEVKREIAGMREAIDAATASRKTATMVRVVAVIVGFVIVIAFVWATVGTIKDLADNPEPLRAQMKQRIEMMNVDQKMMGAVREAAPAYLEHAEQILSDLEVTDKLWEELVTMGKDLEPALREELARVRGPLLQTAEAQADQMARDLDVELRSMIQETLRESLAQHEQEIRQQVDLDEEDVEQLLVTIVEANQQAIMNMAKRRWGNKRDRLAEINNMLAELPKLPPLPESELVDHTVHVLLALLKHKLPDYNLQVELGQRKQLRAVPQAAQPESVVDSLRATLAQPDIPEEAKARVREAISKMGDDRVAAQWGSKKELQRGIEDLEMALEQPMPDEMKEGMRKQLDLMQKALQALEAAE